MILESYAEVDSNQFPSGNTPYQLVQCSTVPNNKKLQICKSELPKISGGCSSPCPHGPYAYVNQK